MTIEIEAEEQNFHVAQPTTLHEFFGGEFFEWIS